MKESTLAKLGINHCISEDRDRSRSLESFEIVEDSIETALPVELAGSTFSNGNDKLSLF